MNERRLYNFHNACKVTNIDRATMAHEFKGVGVAIFFGNKPGKNQTEPTPIIDFVAQ